MQPDLHGATLDSLPNFRDLGGIPVAGGKVRPGRFYRSQRLSAVAAQDLDWLDRAGVAAVVDFRGTTEAAAAPNRLSPAFPGRFVALPVEPSAAPLLDRAEAEGRASAEATRAVMAQVYTGYIDTHADRFAAFLRLLAETGDAGAVVFHCSAGKDRTGFAAALLLSVLGADQEDIARDYLRSNADWIPPHDLAEVVPHRLPLLGVDLPYLRAAFDALDRVHGGAEAFAVSALGGPAALRDFRSGAILHMA